MINPLLFHQESPTAGCGIFSFTKTLYSSFLQFKMSAKPYFPDSWSRRCPRPPSARNSAPAPTRDPAAAAVVAMRWGGRGGSDGGGPPPYRSHDAHRLAYNSALQNDLLGEKIPPFRCREVENSRVSDFQREERDSPSSQATGCP